MAETPKPPSADDVKYLRLQGMRPDNPQAKAFLELSDAQRAQFRQRGLDLDSKEARDLFETFRREAGEAEGKEKTRQRNKQTIQEMLKDAPPEVRNRLSGLEDPAQVSKELGNLTNEAHDRKLKSEWNRVYTTAGGTGAGLLAGAAANKASSVSQGKVIAGRNEELKNLADTARGIDIADPGALAKYKALETAATKGKLGQVPKPIGSLAPAGILGAMGAFSGIQAYRNEDPEISNVYLGQAIGEGSTAAELAAGAAHRYYSPNVHYDAPSIAVLESIRKMRTPEDAAHGVQGSKPLKQIEPPETIPPEEPPQAPEHAPLRNDYEGLKPRDASRELRRRLGVPTRELHDLHRQNLSYLPEDIANASPETVMHVARGWPGIGVDPAETDPEVWRGALLREAMPRLRIMRALGVASAIGAGGYALFHDPETAFGGPKRRDEGYGHLYARGLNDLDRAMGFQGMYNTGAELGHQARRALTEPSEAGPAIKVPDRMRPPKEEPIPDYLDAESMPAYLAGRAAEGAGREASRKRMQQAQARDKYEAQHPVSPLDSVFEKAAKARPPYDEPLMRQNPDLPPAPFARGGAVRSRLDTVHRQISAMQTELQRQLSVTQRRVHIARKNGGAVRAATKAQAHQDALVKDIWALHQLAQRFNTGEITPHPGLSKKGLIDLARSQDT